MINFVKLGLIFLATFLFVLFLGAISILISHKVSAQTTAAVNCNPRPNIGRTTSMGSDGLKVTLTSSSIDNQMTEFKFTKFENGTVRLFDGVITAPFSRGLPANQPFSFVIAQVETGKPTTISMTVKDSCGDYSLFFGGGVDAGWPQEVNTTINVRAFNDTNCNSKYDNGEAGISGIPFTYVLGGGNDENKKILVTNQQGMAVFSGIKPNLFSKVSFPYTVDYRSTDTRNPEYNSRSYYLYASEQVTADFSLTPKNNSVCKDFSLSVDPAEIISGNKVRVSWTGVYQKDADTELTMYVDNSCPESCEHQPNIEVMKMYAGTCSTVKGNAPEVNGSCEFEIPREKSGLFHFIMSKYNLYSRSVKVNAPVVSGTITVDPKKISAGDSIHVSWQNVSNLTKNTQLVLWKHNVGNPYSEYTPFNKIYAASCGTQWGEVAKSNGSCDMTTGIDIGHFAGTTFFFAMGNDSVRPSEIRSGYFEVEPVDSTDVNGNIRFRIAEFNGKNPTGKFLNGVTVQLMDRTAGIELRTVKSEQKNGEDGWVWFDHVDAGIWGVLAYKSGYMGVWKQSNCEEGARGGSYENATIQNQFTEGNVAAWDDFAESNKAKTTVCQDLGLSTTSAAQSGALRFRISEFNAQGGWTGKFLNDVIVKLTDQSGNTVVRTEKSRKVENGEDGWAWFDGVPVGTYGIMAYKSGFDGVWKQVDCKTPGGSFNSATIKNGNSDGMLAAWDNVAEVTAGNVTVCQDLGLKSLAVTAQALDVIKTSAVDANSVNSATLSAESTPPVSSSSAVPSPTAKPSVSPSPTTSPAPTIAPLKAQESTSSAR